MTISRSSSKNSQHTSQSEPATGTAPASRSSGSAPAPEGEARRPKLFGTDGVRGVFGSPPLDESTVRRLAAALAAELALSSAAEGSAPLVVLGGDTRGSTPVLCQWLAGELMARGGSIVFLGTVPTPCVAYTAARLGAACGIAVSASHNPHPDNGIKLIDGRGFKWSPEAELVLEQRMVALEAEDAPVLVGFAGDALPEVDREAVECWLNHLSVAVGEAGSRPLMGSKVALDTGNGAASAFARRLFERFGAEVFVAHDTPDGRNINAGCGSTHPAVLAELVRTHGCDLGFSFDGDADRVVMADERGEVCDGDAVLYLWGSELDRQGELPGRKVVATSMSNLGLEVALRRQGIELVRCDVGDREVVATMERDGVVLGGEQSGHIVHRLSSTTGDGLLTALHMAVLRARAGRPLSELLAPFDRFPQLLHSLRVRHKPDLETIAEVVKARRAVDEALGDTGRLVLRYSGTEPLVRIMIEGPEQGTIEALAARLATVLEEHLA